MASGVYKIVNKVNGKIYVGSAKNIDKRRVGHRSGLRHNKHGNVYLQNAWSKYGEDNFEFSTIEECEVMLLIEREQFYIDLIHPEYNICMRAGSILGFKHTQEVKDAISARALGRKLTQEDKDKISAFRIGRKSSQETKDKISAAGKGRVFTQEHKDKLSASQKGNTNALGCKRSQDYIDKMSVARKGSVHSQEAKDKMSAAHMGKKFTQERKDNMSAVQKKRRLNELQEYLKEYK